MDRGQTPLLDVAKNMFAVTLMQVRMTDKTKVVPTGIKTHRPHPLPLPQHSRKGGAISSALSADELKMPACVGAGGGL